MVTVGDKVFYRYFGNSLKTPPLAGGIPEVTKGNASVFPNTDAS